VFSVFSPGLFLSSFVVSTTDLNELILAALSANPQVFTSFERPQSPEINNVQRDGDVFV
jgi:hypothetical protein